MKILLWLIVLLALFAAVTLWRAASREAASEAAFPPVGQFVEVANPRGGDLVRVHYIDEGPRDAPPVVLIHGASGNVHDWTFDLAGRLSDRYRVLAFDRPGLGYTDMIGRNATAREQAAVLVGATQALGVERPIVAGHSYGGSVALAWAVYHPEQIGGLAVLAGASNPWEGDQGAYYRFLGNPVTGPIMATLLSAWVPDPYVSDAVAGTFAPQSPPDGYEAHYGTGLILRRFSLLENARQRTRLLPQIEAMVPLYPNITVPTEILHGDADIVVPLSIHSRPLSQAIPGANLEIMDGVGHMPHHADPDAIEAAIDRLVVAQGLR
jgi:pimeloyl-ACP methyl ester carboxylesterase